VDLLIATTTMTIPMTNLRRNDIGLVIFEIEDIENNMLRRVPMQN